MKNTYNKKILVVDTFDCQREAIASILDQARFPYDICPDESSALKFARDHKPLVALVHFTEEPIRTIEFIKKLHHFDSTISIIYTTAYRGSHVHHRAIKAGACRVLSPDVIFAGQLEQTLRDSMARTMCLRQSCGNEVFVLMPFAKKYEELYRLGIKEPLEGLQLECNRVDEIQHTGNIMQQVYEGIERAFLVVADMTGRNPNVFYEVGYAHALNKHVILLTEKASDIPFDLQQQRHIVYGRSILKLREELIGAVKAIQQTMKINNA